MPEVLLDSDILIDHLRGVIRPVGISNALRQVRCTEYLSVITVAELAAGQKRQAQEEEKIHCLLALFTHLALDFTMAWRRGEIRRQYCTRIADA